MRLADLEKLIADEKDVDVRNDYEDERIQKIKQVTGLKAGGTLAEWGRRLMGRDEMDEVEDLDFAESHSASNWSQRAWESNGQRVRERAVQYVGRELASPARRQVSLETIGLVEIVYPRLEETFSAPAGALANMPTSDAREALRTCWPDLIASLCDTLRMDAVISLGSEDSDSEYQMGGRRIGNWCSEECVRGKGRSGLLRFIGGTARHRRRRFLTSVLTACGLLPDVAQDNAENVLREAFRQLLSVAKGGALHWLEADERQSDDGPVSAIRLCFAELSLRRPIVLYRSQKTGHLWPRSVFRMRPGSRMQ